MIGDGIEITVVEIGGKRVRLGITAPSSVAVHRKEVYVAVLKENEASGRPVGPGGNLKGRSQACSRSPSTGLQGCRPTQKVA